MLLIFLSLLGFVIEQPPVVDRAGDDTWIAPGYQIEEIVSINPLDYGEPISWSVNQPSIACQMFFVPSDAGEQWRVVIVYNNKVVILQENEEVRNIPISCSPRGAIFSRGGGYVLVRGNKLNQAYDELVNVDTGAVQPYLFREETGWAGFVYVCDNGSTVRLFNGSLSGTERRKFQIISPELAVVESWVDTTTGEWNDGNSSYSTPAHLRNAAFISVSTDGSLIIFSFYNRTSGETAIKAFDGDGNILWEKTENTYVKHVTSNGNYIICTNSSGLCFLDGRTGELIYNYEIDDRINATTCSRTGQSWAFQLYGLTGHYREEQRYDGRRGLIWGIDPSKGDSFSTLTYPSDNWDHINPYRISESGCILGITTALPSSGHNHAVWKFMYVNEYGKIVWISQLVNLNIEHSLCNIATNNFNIEHELGSIPSALQSNGNRFGFYDGNMLLFFKINEGRNN